MIHFGLSRKNVNQTVGEIHKYATSTILRADNADNVKKYESPTKQGEFPMQDSNRMHGRRLCDVATFFFQVDRVEREILALDQIIAQMTCYIEIIRKEVDHSPNEWGINS